MKKLIVRVLIGLIVFFGFLAASVIYLNKVNKAIESSTKLMLLPDKIPIRSEGEQFYVYILLNSQVNKIAAVDTIIKFDKDVLEAVDIVPLGSFPTYPEGSRVVDNEKGLVYLSAVSYDLKNKVLNPYQNIGLYGRMSFRVKKSQATSIDFVFTPGKTNESNIIEAETGKNILLDKNQILGAVVN